MNISLKVFQNKNTGQLTVILPKRKIKLVKENPTIAKFEGLELE